MAAWRAGCTPAWPVCSEPRFPVRCNDMSLDAMRAVLAQLSPLDDPAWRAAVPWFRLQHVARGGWLLREGDYARDIFFVARGLLRELYTTRDGTEVTRVFCAENEISGSLADLLSGAPAMCSIEALEASDVWVMPYAVFEQLTVEHVAWLRFARRNAELLFLRKARREHDLLMLPATARYRLFVAAQPHLQQRVPQHLVASYLGITAVHLSRIRAAARRALPRPARPTPATRRRKT